MTNISLYTSKKVARAVKNDDRYIGQNDMSPPSCNELASAWGYDV